MKPAALNRFFSALRLALLAGAAWGFAPARADLVWTPQGGWKIEGGVLAPYFGDAGETSSALEAMNKAKTAQDAGSLWSALSLYDQVVTNYPSSVFAPEALYQKSLIYIQRHQFDKAFESLNRIIARYPDYPHFNEVIGQQFKLGDRVKSGERPYAWGFFPWFKDMSKATDYYEGVVKNAPYSEYAPMSLMNISTVAMKQSWFINDSEPEVAIDALDRLINNYPQSMLAPNAYLQLANIYSDLVIGPPYDQGSTRQAIRYLRDYLFLYQSSPDAAGAENKLNEMMDVYARGQLILGDFYYYYRNSNRAALIFYNQAITIAPTSPAATEARAQIAKIQKGVRPPMTPYDWLFGRYKEPSTLAYEEQGRIENLANAAFSVQSAEGFLETPGTEAVETINSNGEVKQYEGFAPLVEPDAIAPIDSGFLTPAGPPPGTPPPSTETEGRPLIR